VPSQLGQDYFALAMLGGLRGGFFLDSGASDGVCGSNTLLLEREFGWRGLCVEPNPVFFEALCRVRTAQCVNCCLYDRNGEAPFLEAGTLGGILGEYQPEHVAFVARHIGLIPGVNGCFAAVAKPVRTIESVLNACGAPSIIDYWSLDTEGSELTLLRNFPFDRYAFRVLTVEHNRHPVRHDIRQFLEARGYILVKSFGIDDGYAQADLVRKLLTTGPRNWRSTVFRR